MGGPRDDTVAAVCGRFVSSTSPAELAAQFGVDDGPAPQAGPRWNVAPTDEVLAVATSRGVRRLGAFSWGLLPGPHATKRLINLRAETLAERPAFRRRLERNRCIVPADGFYEWKRPAGPHGAKVPHFIAAADQRPLGLAGLWAAVRRDGAVDGWIRTCTILTCAQNELVAEVHDRMPVVLAPGAWDTWLDDAEDDVGLLSSILVPAPSDALTIWPVSPAVNRVANEGPELVAPVGPPLSSKLSSK